MLVLAEISDKFPSLSSALLGATLLATFSLLLGTVLAVYARPFRWLAIIPSVLMGAAWIQECRSGDFYLVIDAEFGSHYRPSLAFWYCVLHGIVIAVLLFWPAKWSKRRLMQQRCQACGYDLRGLPNAKSPECGIQSATATIR